jgi:hypothetical protein
VYDISGELSEPMNLTNMRSDGKAMFFDFLEEGDTDPVHWRMELTAPVRRVCTGLSYRKDSISSQFHSQEMPHDKSEL